MVSLVEICEAKFTGNKRDIELRILTPTYLVIRRIFEFRAKFTANLVSVSVSDCSIKSKLHGSRSGPHVASEGSTIERRYVSDGSCLPLTVVMLTT
jgi:hypothetical protein